MEQIKRRPLDRDYVGEILGQPVKTFSLSEGSKKGDNVIGKMLSMKVELEEEEGEPLHLVIKSLIPLAGEVTEEMLGQAQMFTQLRVFPSELAYYKEVRPLLQTLTGFPLTSPRFYSGLTDGVNDYLALEDLRPKGYKMADKKKGLTVEEVNAVLRKVASLHAHSYAVIVSKHPSMEELRSPSSILTGHVWAHQVFDLDQAIFFNGIIQKMSEILRETGDGEKAERLQRFTKTGHKTILDLSKKTDSSPKYFPVILHGDLWTNNVLFKYSNSNPSSIKDLTFIDFQQCRFGNVYEDLLYFFFTSTTAQFRKLNLRSCLQHYHREFSQILQSLPDGFSVPLPKGFTDEELIATFYENIEYGLCYNLVGIPFQLGEQHLAQAADEPKSPPPPTNNHPPQGEETAPPSALAMAMMMAEMMKQGTKSSPVALQRLKELMNEMRKLNVL